MSIPLSVVRSMYPINTHVYVGWYRGQSYVLHTVVDDYGDEVVTSVEPCNQW